MTKEGKWEQLELFPEIDWESQKVPTTNNCDCECDCCVKPS